MKHNERVINAVVIGALILVFLLWWGLANDYASFKKMCALSEEAACREAGYAPPIVWSMNEKALFCHDDKGLKHQIKIPACNCKLDPGAKECRFLKK
ncbi:MAG: hypothetical protein WCX97_01035 [Candidatus Magasanikbacteria bacterium]